jgi:hypothetical protein
MAILRPIPCWLSLFCLFAHNLISATAADGPAIRASTILMGTDGKISFQFDATGGASDQFELQSASRLGSPVEWQKGAANISELMPKLYQVIVPANPAGRFSFYRIVQLAPPIAPLVINEVMSKNMTKIKAQDGGFYDWIEVYNPNDAAVNLQGYGLSDDPSDLHQWQFPNTFIQPSSYLLVFASGLDSALPGGELHTNFRLNAGGDDIFLTSPDGKVLDEVQALALLADQSAGRFPDGSDNWYVYPKTSSTPGAENANISSGPIIDPPQFPTQERFFPSGTVLNVALQASLPGQTIRYTTNGAPPTSTSSVYNASLTLKQTTLVRALAFEGTRSSAEATATFFIGADHSLPVISLGTLPSNFDFRNGFLYGMGSALNSSGQVVQNFPFSGSNAWLDREIPISLEFYEPNHELGFQLRAGLKIYGGWGSRGYPQKGMALFARQKYGDGKINYRIFPEKEIKDFETLVFRNSGNDNQSSQQTPVRPPITAFGTTTSYGSYFVNGNFTMMRDAMEQHLIKDIGLDIQAYRPAVMYINGDYWGIYNLREKMNEDYIITNHDLKKGQVDLIEGFGTVLAGDSVVYRAMRDFVSARDLRIQTNYNFVAENYLDIDNFIDYHLSVIYFQNFDIGNIKCWRPRKPQGKFKWMVYDQDYGFNLWKPEVYIPAMRRDYADYDNMFDFYTAGTGTSTTWPNGGGVTLLLRKMLANEGFKQRFVKRCADLLNGPFREETVVRTIEEMAAVIRPEIPRHLQRWSWPQLQQRGFGLPHQREFEAFTQETWEKNLQVMIDFAKKRPAKLRQDCVRHFGLLAEQTQITVSVEPPSAGRAKFNSIILTNFPWSGVFFKDYPLTITAIPKPGYRFIEWITPGTNTNQPQWEINATRTTNLLARFEAIPPSPIVAPPVLISELQYHPAAENESGDWVELHNPGTEPIRLAGWNLRDHEDDHDFLLPEISLPPGGYIVLCQDAAKFSRVYPSVTNFVGDFVFGLGNEGDTIRLFDPTGNLIARITYNDKSPWPPEPDGTGHTLQLINPNTYSENPKDWKSSLTLGGTPGKAL